MSIRRRIDRLEQRRQQQPPGAWVPHTTFRHYDVRCPITGEKRGALHMRVELRKEAQP